MKFSFKHFYEEDIVTEMKRFDSKKSSTSIPIKFLKETIKELVNLIMKGVDQQGASAVYSDKFERYLQ